jgi:hypothetical protein
MKKYIIIGGRVISRFDGQEHFIHASRLCALYGVNTDECYLLNEESAEDNLRLESLPRLPILRPRHDGEYNQPQ